MSKLYHNDQTHIAEQFNYVDDHISQMAQLAFLKINSYKLSLINSAFCMSREELSDILKSTLLNYTDTCAVLAETGFFETEIEN
jgi:hypothetical protein